eukprot:1391974-Pyramimonas_sp.AAC.1
MNVPQLSAMRSRKAVPVIPSFAKWRVPPGMEKVFARRLDHALAPTSHPFAGGEEEGIISNEDEFDVGIQAKAIRRTASSFPEGLQHDPLRPPSMTKEDVE